MSDRHCDWRGRCKRKPYREVFWIRITHTYSFVGGGWDRTTDHEFRWSYLCRWHFYVEWIKYKFFNKIPARYYMVGWGDVCGEEEDG